MKLIRPSFEIISDYNPLGMLQLIERAGRTCYKSEDRIAPGTATNFVSMVCKRNHESVLEHASISVRFICDRGVSHELVRHRIASFSQESTRYCNYGSNKKGITFIIPPWTELEPTELTEDNVHQFYADAYENLNVNDVRWVKTMLYLEGEYNKSLDDGWKPEQARDLLPNSLKTEIVVTANLREWKHIFKVRVAPAAHPQMCELMEPLQRQLILDLPEIFSVDV